MEKFKYLIQTLLSNLAKQTAAKQPIAKHLARVALYELKGEDALYPNVKEKYKKLEERMAELNKPIWLVEGFRTAKRQDSLSSEVTRARGLQSYHQYGLAFDVAFDKYNWKPPHGSWWDVLRVEAEKLNLQGIGSWDAGHFEFHPSFTWRDLKPYFK